MRITVQRTIAVEGKHVEKGESVDTSDAIAKQLIADGDAVGFVAVEKPAKAEKPAK